MHDTHNGLFRKKKKNICKYKQMAKSEGRGLGYGPPCDTVSRPDISPSLPIFREISRFLIIMKISRSPDLNENLPIFFTKDYASTVDRQFCHSSRRIDCQFGECCLKPFANCVVIEKNTACVFAAPGRRHIRRDTVVPHARAPGFCDRVTVIMPNPFIGHQSKRGRGLSRATP